jgi:hypothetical protein
MTYYAKHSMQPQRDVHKASIPLVLMNTRSTRLRICLLT